MKITIVKQASTAISLGHRVNWLVSQVTDALTTTWGMYSTVDIQYLAGPSAHGDLLAMVSFGFDSARAYNTAKQALAKINLYKEEEH